MLSPAKPAFALCRTTLAHGRLSRDLTNDECLTYLHRPCDTGQPSDEAQSPKRAFRRGGPTCPPDPRVHPTPVSTQCPTSRKLNPSPRCKALSSQFLIGQCLTPHIEKQPIPRLSVFIRARPRPIIILLAAKPSNTTLLPTFAY